MSSGPMITEQDRAEAACVTARGGGHQFEIQLGHLCNNRCVFCSSGQLTQLKIARHIPLDPMIAAIENARASGARRITFLGGEPTLHKGFLDALKRTVELGFEEIVIFTNGVLLPHPGFIDKVVALGRFEWRISIQGGNEDAHVAVTKRKDSFQRIITGLKMLRERGQLVTANMCVNELSYRSLPDYVDLVAEYGLRQLHVDIVRPASTGERSLDYLREIMPRYSDMAPYLAQMLEGFDQRDPSFDVNVGNLPYCILPSYAHRIHHGGEETITQSCDDTALEVAVDKYEWHASLRRHLPACDACVLRPQCTGIFSTYLEIHGADEFQPVTLEQLRASNGDGRHFVVVSEPHLTGLEAAARTALPEGWTLEDWRRDSHERRIDVRLRHEQGGAVALAFTHTGTGEAPLVHRSHRFDLRMVADPELESSAVEDLVAWVESELEVALDPSDLLRLHSEARAHRVRQRKVRALADRIVGLREVDGWSVAGATEEGEASVVGFVRSDGMAVDVLLSQRFRDGHARIAVDARLGRGAEPRDAHSLVAAVSARLSS